MFLAEVDHWVGKTLFVPPIIKFCQLTRQSQYACSRLFWFVVSLDGLHHAHSLGAYVFWGGLSVLLAFTATLCANTPTVSLRLFRLLGLVCFAYDVVKGTLTGAWAGTEFWMLVLIAEYAATIRTIPPVECTKPAAEQRTLR